MLSESHPACRQVWELNVDWLNVESFFSGKKTMSGRIFRLCLWIVGEFLAVIAPKAIWQNCTSVSFFGNIWRGHMFSTPHNGINQVPVKNIMPKYPVEETEVLNFRFESTSSGKSGSFSALGSLFNTTSLSGQSTRTFIFTFNIETNLEISQTNGLDGTIYNFPAENQRSQQLHTQSCLTPAPQGCSSASRVAKGCLHQKLLKHVSTRKIAE